MKTYTTTVINFKGTSNELINAVKSAKKLARKQVENTNITPSGVTVKLIGRRFITISNKHVTSEIVSAALVPDHNVFEGTIEFGINSNWPSIIELTKNGK